jgi:Domain of unknown function (DUF4276)
MANILILVEGQAEESFVKGLIAPYLLEFGLYATPIIITTKENPKGTNIKGGGTHNSNAYQKLIRKQVLDLLKDANAYVSTFFDYYGLPTDFPDLKICKNKQNLGLNIYQRVEGLEKAFASDIDNQRFIPYIQLHEFETLLFTDIRGFEYSFGDTPSKVKQIQAIINQFSNPELINDSPQTAPSKRLLEIFPNYQKVVEGNVVALENSIENIISKCPHFEAWITQLKNLKNKT